MYGLISSDLANSTHCALLLSIIKQRKQLRLRTKADINLLQLLQGIMAIILWIFRIEMETTRDMSASDGQWGQK